MKALRLGVCYFLGTTVTEKEQKSPVDYDFNCLVLLQYLLAEHNVNLNYFNKIFGSYFTGEVSLCVIWSRERGD